LYYYKNHRYFIFERKVKSGVDAQVDSWGGMLSPVDYQEFFRILTKLSKADHAPVIVFGKGCWFALNEMGKSRASALG
jgi:uroporphyrinogen decarboxylase